jgi:hypothetical protein
MDGTAQIKVRIETNEEKSFFSRVWLKNVSQQKYDLSRIFKCGQSELAETQKTLKIRFFRSVAGHLKKCKLTFS